jgi:hypothetical protein
MPLAGQSPKEVIHTEMHRFKHGQLHSGSKRGPLVRSRSQAIAIALSEARKAKGRAMGGPMWGDPAAGMGQFYPPAIGGFQPQNMLPPVSGLGGTLPPSYISPPAQSLFPPISGFGGPQLDMADSLSSPPPNPPAQPPQGQPPVVPAAMNAPRPPAVGSVPGPGGTVNPPGSWQPQKGYAFGGLTRPPSPSWTVRNEARSMLHSGPISSVVPGRTDRHGVNVASGSYVIPADTVSHLGQSNTKAGHTILSHMFGDQGPYGAGKAMGIRRGAGPPKPPGMQKTPSWHMPKISSGGGQGGHAGNAVPVVVAGGEFTVPAHIVEAIGGGDVKRGHRVLDAWVMNIRRDHIKTLRGLPPPAKD